MSLESRRAYILRRKDTHSDLMEEVRPYLGMSPERKDELSLQAALLTAQMLRDRGDAPRAPEWVDPLPESSRKIWSRLMEQYRRERSPG